MKKTKAPHKAPTPIAVPVVQTAAVPKEEPKRLYGPLKTVFRDVEFTLQCALDRQNLKAEWTAEHDAELRSLIEQGHWAAQFIIHIVVACMDRRRYNEDDVRFAITPRNVAKDLQDYIEWQDSFGSLGGQLKYDEQPSPRGSGCPRNPLI